MGRELVLLMLSRGARVAAVTANSGVDIPGGDERSVRMTQPDQAARIMVEGIEKDKLHIYVGLDARLMSLAIKIAPRPAIRFVQKQMAKALAPAVP